MGLGWGVTDYVQTDAVTSANKCMDTCGCMERHSRVAAHVCTYACTDKNTHKKLPDAQMVHWWL